MINLDKINKLLVFLTDNGIGLNAITINDDSFILDLFENENQKRKSNIIEKKDNFFNPSDYGFIFMNASDDFYNYSKIDNNNLFTLNKSKNSELYEIQRIFKGQFLSSHKTYSIDVLKVIFKNIGVI